MDLEKSSYHNFMNLWNRGNFRGQRLGQAFYNYFSPHRLNDQGQLRSLYEKDGMEAHLIINKIFRFI